MSGLSRDELVADLEARIDRITSVWADEVNHLANEIDRLTGQCPQTSIAGRGNFLAARWGIVEYYREQARHLLAAMQALEPLMVGKPGRTVEMVLKTADPVTAARIARDLEGAGLVRFEGGVLVPTPPE